MDIIPQKIHTTLGRETPLSMKMIRSSSTEEKLQTVMNSCPHITDHLHLIKSHPKKVSTRQMKLRAPTLQGASRCTSPC